MTTFPSYKNITKKDLMDLHAALGEYAIYLAHQSIPAGWTKPEVDEVNKVSERLEKLVSKMPV